MHKSLQEVQSETTSTEFLEWIQYFEIEVNEFNRTDYFLAQIACEVRRGHSKNPRDPKLKDFLLTFRTASSPSKPPPTLAQSKAFWLAALGITTKKKPEKQARKKGARK